MAGILKARMGLCRVTAVQSPCRVGGCRQFPPAAKGLNRALCEPAAPQARYWKWRRRVDLPDGGFARHTRAILVGCGAGVDCMVSSFRLLDVELSKLQRNNSAGDESLCFQVRDLRRVYGKGTAAVQALRGVDLQIPERELVVILGASGSGKSTFLNIVGGLDRPSSGEVRFRGVDLAAASARELTEYRRRHVGFVFQFYNLMPSLTAWENVALITEISEAPLAPADALALVGLSDRMNHFPAQLSGGEQQRVAIARAVAKQPSVMLCDEPTGALDSSTGVKVLEALLDVNRSVGATTLIITHNAGVAEIADRIVVFADGMVRESRRNPAPRSPRDVTW